MAQRSGRGLAHSIGRPTVPISSPLTHMVYRIPSGGYVAGSKSVSARPSDSDTMTNTALPVHRAAKSISMRDVFLLRAMFTGVGLCANWQPWSNQLKAVTPIHAFMGLKKHSCHE